MNWSKPLCGNCKAEGEKCGLKMSNDTEPEIKCIKKPTKGTYYTIFHIILKGEIMTEDISPCHIPLHPDMVMEILTYFHFIYSYFDINYSL